MAIPESGTEKRRKREVGNEIKKCGWTTYMDIGQAAGRTGGQILIEKNLLVGPKFGLFNAKILFSVTI